jgi:hypothetical protein
LVQCGFLLRRSVIHIQNPDLSCCASIAKQPYSTQGLDSSPFRPLDATQIPGDLYACILRIPNGESDLNSMDRSTDLNGATWQYPGASYKRRQEIWDEHVTWAQGLIYFLQSDPAAL